MLTITFALLWIYLVAQGATAFQIVSEGGYWLGLFPALAIEIGEIVALILWSSEAKSEVKSWQFSAVVISASLSALVQYLAADSVAGDKVGVELKVALSVGVSTLAVFLGKSAGERFVTWQIEFRQWKTAEMEWKAAEERQAERLEYERRQEADRLEYERKQAEEGREYRRKRKEEREKVKAEGRGGKLEGTALTAKRAPKPAEMLSDSHQKRLEPLVRRLGRNGISVSAEEAFRIMGVGKSQGYKILSAGISAGILEKSGRKWKRRTETEKDNSAALLPEGMNHDRTQTATQL